MAKNNEIKERDNVPLPDLKSYMAEGLMDFGRSVKYAFRPESEMRAAKEGRKALTKKQAETYPELFNMPRMEQMFPDLKKASPESPEATMAPTDKEAKENVSVGSPKTSYWDSLEQNLLKGMPEFPVESYDEAARTAGKLAKTEAKKASEAAVLSKEALENYGKNLDKAQSLNNQIYTNWLESSEKASKDINSLMEKYPALSRADVIRNMSTGEKIITSLLTGLGSAFSSKDQENMALRAFERNLDEAVTLQNVNYERERQNILTDKFLTDQKLEMSMRKSENDYKMLSANLDSALKIAEVSRLERSPEELQDVEDNAKANINLYKSSALLNYNLDIFNKKETAKMFTAKLQAEQGKRVIPIQFAERGKDGVHFSKYQPMFIANENDRDKIVSKYLDYKEPLEALQSIVTLVNKGSNRKSIDTAVQNYNDRFKSKLGDTSVIPFKDDIRDVIPAIFAMQDELKDKLNGYLNGTAVLPFEG